MSGTVVIVDIMSFRRARDEYFLTPWAEEENVELLSMLPSETRNRLVDNSECRMLIYDIGAQSADNKSIRMQLEVLRALCPTTVLVVLSDDGGSESIGSALSAGVQGYLVNSMSPELALQTLSFLLHGGTYFPLTALTELSVRKPMQAGSDSSEDVTDREPKPVLASGGPRTIDRSANQWQATTSEQQRVLVLSESPEFSFANPLDDLTLPLRPRKYIGVATILSLMTDRQRSVSMCLCQGDSNKIIGRKLGMTETTVKVHVREIMRKLGVGNRTQVAIALGKSGLGGTSDEELSSQESVDGSGTESTTSTKTHQPT